MVSSHYSIEGGMGQSQAMAPVGQKSDEENMGEPVPEAPVEAESQPASNMKWIAGGVVGVIAVVIIAVVAATAGGGDSGDPSNGVTDDNTVIEPVGAPTVAPQKMLPVSSPVSSPGSMPQEPSPGGTPVSAPSVPGPIACCPEGFTGHRAVVGCQSFYQCVNGNMAGIVQSCAPGTSFDETRTVCDFPGTFTCQVEPCAGEGGGQGTGGGSNNNNGNSGNNGNEDGNNDNTSATADGRCCAPGFTGYKASYPDCSSYYQCLNGRVFTDYQKCSNGLIFWEDLKACGYPNVACASDPCGQPDDRPTRAPVEQQPTRAPIIPPTAAPITPAPTLPPQPTAAPVPQPSFPPGTFPAGQKVEDALNAAKDGINENLLRSLAPNQTWQPSVVYRYQGMYDGLLYMYREGVAGLKFYVGEDNDDTNGHIYGLVNVAAFLAQSMQESIQYDVCDENSWDRIDGRYPLSNSCGQLGQSYQDYTCPAGEEHMACEVDPDMTITAVTSAKWYGAPAPLKCGPKSVYPFTGYWNHNCECDKPWANPPEYCTDYEGQKAGCENNEAPYGNFNGRTDVEGCCWWGRGVIQTTGPCNFGKLNYFLGKRASVEGRPSAYPHLDFCKDPEIICSSEEHKELKWIAGMFYWMVSVQEHKEEGFDYLAALKDYVDTGMTSTNFIDSVSGIVNRGCAFPPCVTGDVHAKLERREHFRRALEEFGVL